MVRVDDAGLDVAAWDAVRPGCVHGGELRKEATVSGVGTIVDQERAAAASDRAVALDACFERDDHAFAAMVGCDELLASREDELGRALSLAGDSGDVCLEVELALATKATAKVGDDHAHGVLGHLERMGDTSAGVKRHLRRGPDRDLIAMPLGNDRARLDRGGVLHVGHVATTDDGVGLGHPLVDIAEDERGAASVVAVAHDVKGVAVRLPIGVHERGARGSRLFDVVHHRQRLNVDLDQVERGLCNGGSRGGDSGDDLALEAHPLTREQATVLDVRTVLKVGNVGVCDDGEHAGESLGFAGVETRDATIGDAGVEELAVRHASELHVCRVATETGHLVLAILALKRPALDNGHGGPPSLCEPNSLHPTGAGRRVRVCALWPALECWCHAFDDDRGGTESGLGGERCRVFVGLERRQHVGGNVASIALAGTTNSTANTEEGGRAERVGQRAQPVVAFEAATVTGADDTWLELDVVVDHDDLVEWHFEVMDAGADGAARVVHKRLGCEHTDGYLAETNFGIATVVLVLGLGALF